MPVVVVVVVVVVVAPNRPIEKAHHQHLHAQQKPEEGREERPQTKREFFCVVVSRFVALVVLFLASSPKAKERERKEKKSKKNGRNRVKVQHYVLNLVCFEIVIVHRFRRSTSPLGRAHDCWLSRFGRRLVAVAVRRRRPPRHSSCGWCVDDDDDNVMTLLRFV